MAAVNYAAMTQEDRENRIFRAVIDNNLPLVNSLLLAGVNIEKLFYVRPPRDDAFHDYSETLLCMASLRGHTAIIRRLIEAGADINAPNAQGLTPLLSAIKSGNIEPFSLLIELGADINKPDTKGGRTPLHFVSINLYPVTEEQILPMVEILLSMDDIIDIEARDRFKSTPLNSAAMGLKPAIVKRLLNARANIETRDNLGRTPLYRAMGHTPKNAETVKVLLDAGADYNAIGSGGVSVINVARRIGYAEIVELMEDAKRKRLENISHLTNTFSRVNRYAARPVATLPSHSAMSAIPRVARNKIASYLSGENGALFNQLRALAPAAAGGAGAPVGGAGAAAAAMGGAGGPAGGAGQGGGRRRRTLRRSKSMRIKHQRKTRRYAA